MTTELDALVAHMEQTRSTMEQAVSSFMPTQEEMNAFFAEIEAEEKNKIDSHDDLVAALRELADVAGQCDSWESFPSDPLEKAYAALAKAGVK